MGAGDLFIKNEKETTIKKSFLLFRNDYYRLQSNYVSFKDHSYRQKMDDNHLKVIPTYK